VLRRISGATRDEVTGEWRRLLNEELYALRFSPNIILVIKLRRLKWVGHLACTGERRGAYWILVEKPEGRRRLGRARNKWEDIFKMDLREGELGTWTGSVWLRIGSGWGIL
jgi:hypothetical protein